MINKNEIKKIYKIIEKNHKKHLENKGVALPKLKNKNGKYTKDALTLIYLSKDYPDNSVISKKELTFFIKSYYPEVNDVQQARHLSMQKGWYILSGQRGDKDVKNKQIPAGSYKLINLKTPYPAFIEKRRRGFSGNFKLLKKKYNFHCATCGSKEGKEHLFRKNVIIKLQKGHMDPNKPYGCKNIIPQCQICNRADRNKWVYDKTGRVIEIAETQDGIRIIKTFFRNASPKLNIEIFNFLKILLKK